MYFSFNGLCHSQKKSKIVAVRTVIIIDVEMYALRRGSAYVNVHTDILYIHPHRRSQRWTHHIQNHNSLLPRSHSWSIVCLWRPTFSCFSHVRQLSPLSLRLLDSALVVWICRRTGAEGTMPCSCLTLLIELGHGSKILPTATPWDNKGLSAGRTAETLPWQHNFAYLCVHLSWEC